MSTPTPPNPKDKYSFERMINHFRWMHLMLAEAIDVWRIVPRMVIGLYGAMLWWLVKWFTATTTVEKVTCDAKVMMELIDKGVDMAWVQQLSCTVTDIIVVAPPTAVHAAFASVVAGMSTAVFALYTTSARDWHKGIGWWTRNKPSSTPPNPPTP